MKEFEFKVRLPDGRVVECVWFGKDMESAAKRLLACKFPDGQIIAWRYPTYAITTAVPRGI